MDDSTKDFLIKVLLWGGGGILALVLLSSLVNAAFTILTFPFRQPWAFLVLAGIGYALYQKFIKSEQKSEEFEEIDEDFHFD
ncbi:MAG: hypothetical protein ACOC82_04010 [Candidatus Bipolaricaulota bacterium]